MQIMFYIVDQESDDPIGIRDWPCVPRKGDTVTLTHDKKDCFEGVVDGVYWGDHVTGEGEPICDNPCASVELKENKS